MADNTIAKAYVQIIPTTKGITNTLNTELGGSADAAGESAGKGFGKKMLGAISALGIGAAIGSVIKQSLDEGGALEQSFGGLETIYGEAANAAKAYAAEAAKAGISANEYAEQAVSFGASLKQAFSGDVTKAVEAANTAIMDMTDNAAKMGTPIENIQNAYQGFAKQNYTMLDNLKLGYGGTKTEMERLLKDAQKLTGVEYNIDNLGDVYDAIHAIQGSLGLTGVAADEAKTTLTGSLGAMSASFKNVLGNLALGEDIKPSLNTLMENVTTFITSNLIPMASNVISALPDALATTIEKLAPNIIPGAIELVIKLIEGIGKATPQLLKSIAMLIPQMAKQLIQAAPQLFTTARQAFANITKAIPEVMRNAFNGMVDVGWNLLKGLWNGISNAFDWVIGKIRNIGYSILSTLKSVFSIHSPSKETSWMGDMLMQGLANGIDDNAKKAVNSMKNAADSALGAVDTGAFNFSTNGKYSVNGASGNGGVNNITLNVYGAQGQDVRELANIVMSEIQSETERKVAAFA